MNSSRLSIIIPVLHEAGNINDHLDHLHSLDPSGYTEIIVVDGDAEGGTIKMVRDEKVVTAISDPGRAIQMNRGAARASGDILLFLHADTLLPPDAFEKIRRYMSDSRFVAGAFDLGIGTGRRLLRITEHYVALRTRLTNIPFGDQAVFIRKEYFEKIGGFKPIPIMEDVEIMARIRKRGDRICIIPEKVTTSARRWEKEGVLFSTFRNWTLQILYLVGVPPERLAKFYR